MDERYLLWSSVHALSATGLECADGRLHVLVQKTSIYIQFSHPRAGFLRLKFVVRELHRCSVSWVPREV